MRAMKVAVLSTAFLWTGVLVVMAVARLLHLA
jgi:hypothetical protein